MGLVTAPSQRLRVFVSPWFQASERQMPSWLIGAISAASTFPIRWGMSPKSLGL